MTLRFEAPDQQPRHVYAQELEEMKAHPNRWVLLDTLAPAKASAAGKVGHKIRQGILSACQPAGSFEATQRTVDGEIRLYARYVGGEQP